MMDAYIKFSTPTLTGESRDHENSGWSEVLYWENKAKQTRSATASTAGGHTAGRANQGGFIFGKHTDLVSPLLFQHCSGGTTFDEVVLQCYRANANGERVMYQEIRMKKVIISEVKTLGSEGVPLETYKLHFGAIRIKHTQQKISGDIGGSTLGEWSYVKNDKTYSV